MTKSSWEAQLSSSSERERLAGVRWISENGDPSMLPTLRLMRVDEPNSWVQRAIDQVVRRWTGEEYGVTLEPWDAPSVSSQRLARANEVQRISKIFVHEMSHLAGAAISAAARELGDQFPPSDTAQALNRISDFLSVLEQLHDAASSPVLSEFNLSDCVRRSAAQVEQRPGELLFSRDDSVIALGDEIRLRLALVNVIRNAVEASRELEGRTVVSWAETDSGYWVSILDEGPGLPDGFSNAVAPGASTKRDHGNFGWGLTIAAQALETFGATLRLSPGSNSGTVCQIRWDKRGMDEK